MQNLEQVVQDLVTKNAALQSRVQEFTEILQQLQSSERDKQTIRQQLTAELTRAEETIRREQQQKLQVSVMCVTCSECCDYIADCRKLRIRTGS